MRLRVALSALVALAGCRHHEHRERTVVVERQSPPSPRPAAPTSTAIVYEERPGEVTVYRQPPAPRDESVNHGERPTPRHVWIPGHWAWHGHWEWVSGHWHRVPTGRRAWVAGRWQFQPASGCYLWVGGRWE